MEGCKRITEGRKEGNVDTFQLKTLFQGLMTILWAWKFFLKPMEMAVSPRQGVRIYLVIFSGFIKKLVICSVGDFNIGSC